MKLLILGASGLTGYKVMQRAKKRFDTFGTYNVRPVNGSSLIKMDLASQGNLAKVISEIRPNIVVNTTALHNVDYCESHEKEAYYVNGDVVRMLAEICNTNGSRLIHISTDFVFDGKKGTSYSESDEPNPQSVYAKSKLEGEQNAATCGSYCVLRTSVVYGWTPVETLGSTSSSGKPMNFALWAMSKLSKGEEVKIVSDQFTSPTLADVLAEVIVRLAESDKSGIYHISGTTCISRYEFTRKIAATMGYSPDLVKPIDSNSFVQVAKRPANSCLNCEKVQKELNYKLLGVDESLSLMRSQVEVESPGLLG